MNLLGWLSPSPSGRLTQPFLQNCEIRVSAGVVCPASSLPGLQMAVLSLCPHTGCPLCGRIPGVSLWFQISSSHSPIGLGPTEMASCNSVTSSKTLSNTVTF